MHVRVRAFSATLIAISALSVFLLTSHIHGQVPGSGRGRTIIRAQTNAERRAWTSRIDSMLRSGELRLRQTRDDPMMPDRTHERADQYYRGVRVFGADVAPTLGALAGIPFRTTDGHERREALAAPTSTR